VGFQTDTVVVACIVAVVAPSILAVGNARINDKRQTKEWAREDAVEERRIAREHEREQRTETRLDDISAETRIIHALVNSELTKAYERDLSSVIASRDALEKVIELTCQLGEKPDQIDVNELEDKENRIRLLEKVILMRQQHQEILDEKVKPTHPEETP